MEGGMPLPASGPTSLCLRSTLCHVLIARNASRGSGSRKATHPVELSLSRWPVTAVTALMAPGTEEVRYTCIPHT